jgi:hypothetical protein
MKFGRVRINLPPRKHITYGLGGKEFVIRYLIIESPWFDLLVRNLVRPNPDAPPHSHGVTMYTLCFRGGYDDIVTDGRVRKVRFGTFTCLPKEVFHSTTAIIGKAGAWTLGIDARWQGLNSPGYEIDGKFMSMWRYAEKQGAPPEMVAQIKELVGHEHARRAEA